MQDYTKQQAHILVWNSIMSEQVNQKVKINFKILSYKISEKD